MLILFATLAAGAAFIFLLYRRGFVVTKCITAVLFVFWTGKDGDHTSLNSCTGWIRHMGRFRENRVYVFHLDCQLSRGDAQVTLLDSEKRELLRFDRNHTTGTIELNGKRYYLRWEFENATGTCRLCW